jgi:hypothetical protein
LANFDGGNNLIDIAFGSSTYSDIYVNTTGLLSLNLGTTSDLSSVGNVTIVNNTKLDQVILAAANISHSLNIEGRNFYFPNLIGITENITISNVDSVSLDALTSVGSNIVISESLYLANFTLGELQTLGGSIDVTGNVALNTLSIPNLQTMGGGFQILNNSALQNLTGFPKLRSVGQSADIEGPIDA